MFKMLDAFSDVFQGLFQQQGHLEYAGQALALRVFLAGCAYTVTLWLTQNSILAAVSMPAASVLCIVLFDMRVAKRFVDRVRPVFSGAACRKILAACLPLFASSFMNMYILNATKMQVDAVIPQMQGYWTPLYMPAAIINLLSIFAFRPMLTTLRAKGMQKSAMRSAASFCSDRLGDCSDARRAGGRVVFGYPCFAAAVRAAACALSERSDDRAFGRRAECACNSAVLCNYDHAPSVFFAAG